MLVILTGYQSSGVLHMKGNKARGSSCNHLLEFLFWRKLISASCQNIYHLMKDEIIKMAISRKSVTCGCCFDPFCVDLLKRQIHFCERTVFSANEILSGSKSNRLYFEHHAA